MRGVGYGDFLKVGCVGWCGDGVGMVWEGIEEAEEAGGGEWGRGRRRWSRG